jgi:hypothetical protein
MNFLELELLKLIFKKYKMGIINERSLKICGKNRG